MSFRVWHLIFLLVTLVTLTNGAKAEAEGKNFVGTWPKEGQEVSRNPWGFFEFWWSGPNKTGPYTLQIAKDKDFKDIIYFQTVNRIHDFTRHLPDSGKVYWRVLYQDMNTPSYSLNIIPPKDSSITIEEAKIVPFDEKENKTGSIQLKWQEPSETGPYDVEISPDPEFKKLVFRKRVKEQSYSIESFADAGRFFWRVRKGRIVSPVGQFYINQAMVNAALRFSGPTIQLKFPENGGQVDFGASTFQFEWESLGYETEYTLEVSRTGDFESVIFKETSKENKIQVSNFEEKGSYFWRVSSPRYESPIHSFVVASAPNIFQKGLNLFDQIFFVRTKKTYFLGMDYRFSSINGNDLDNSTSGTLVADSYYVIKGGLTKTLFPDWEFNLSADFSIVSRQPPENFELRTPVSSLFGIQSGVKNTLLKDFKAGFFLRYSQFEILQTITGSSFGMNTVSALSVGGEGEYRLFSWLKTNCLVGARFYSTLPLITDLRSGFASEFFVDFDFKLFSPTRTSLGLYYQNIGIVADDSSQNSDAAGVQLTWFY